MRPRKCRFIETLPCARFYKPQGIPMRNLETVQLKDEELEAIILCDHQKRSQQEAATQMQISRPTFSRILTSARSTMAKALAEGKALKIGGGNYRRQDNKTRKAGKKMKILISSTGQELGAPMDTRFGRAPYFLIYDTENAATTVINNQEQVDASQGAGIQSATIAVKAGVDIVITGRCGPKAKHVLDESGIKIHIALNLNGSDALEMFLAGDLPKIADQD